MPLAYADGVDLPTASDYQNIFITNDASHIFIRVSLYAASDLAIFYNNIFVDGDNASTGYSFRLGSEMLIQGGAGYQQKNGGFNEGGATGLDLALAPAAVGTDFEWRVSRRAAFETDGQPVYGGGEVTFRFELISNLWALLDSVPQGGGGGVTLTLAELPPMPPGSLQARLANGAVEITGTGSGPLESKDTLGTGAWTAIPAAKSPYRPEATAAQRFYRLRQ